MSLVGGQINTIDVNFHLKKSLEIFDTNSADKIQSQDYKGDKSALPHASSGLTQYWVHSCLLSKRNLIYIWILSPFEVNLILSNPFFDPEVPTWPKHRFPQVEVHTFRSLMQGEALIKG